MISIWVVLYLILTHWISDFVLQSRVMFNNKSSSNYYLFMHVSIYSIITIISWLLLNIISGVKYTSVTMLIIFTSIFISHWITDYITSRITSKLAKEEKWYYFFLVFGIDQVLHYIQILTIYSFFLK